MSVRAMTLVLLLPLAACATVPPRGPAVVLETPVPAAATGWQAIASAADQTRIAALPATWAAARAAVPRRLIARRDAEGALVAPQAALTLPAIPPGSYRCRLVRFGGRTGFAAFPADYCYVAGDETAFSFTKQTGDILPGGWIHPDSATRQIFLGTLRKDSKGIAPGYGHDPVRDVAGVIERVAPQRWRLVLTRAGHGALLDLYELVPAPPEIKTPAPVAKAAPAKPVAKPAPTRDVVTIIDTAGGQIPFDCGPSTPHDTTSAADAERRAKSCSAPQPKPAAPH